MDLYPQKFSYSAKSSNVLFHLRDSKMHKPQEKNVGSHISVAPENTGLCFLKKIDLRQSFIIIPRRHKLMEKSMVHTNLSSYIFPSNISLMATFLEDCFQNQLISLLASKGC